MFTPTHSCGPALSQYSPGQTLILVLCSLSALARSYFSIICFLCMVYSLWLVKGRHRPWLVLPVDSLPWIQPFPSVVPLVSLIFFSRWIILVQLLLFGCCSSYQFIVSSYFWLVFTQPCCEKCCWVIVTDASCHSHDLGISESLRVPWDTYTLFL